MLIYFSRCNSSMPYQGEHSARINPPGKFEKLRRQNNKFGKGVHAIFGVLKEGGSEVQAIHFDSDLFTPEQAKEWLKEHDYKPIEFASALKEEEEVKEAEEPKQNHRYLAIEMAPSADIQDIGGGLMVPGVKLLAPGTWTDSTQKTPCRYNADLLERLAQNWTDRSYWSRHQGGTPRDIMDRIADIRNTRYQDGIVADLFFHGATSKSMDAISLIKAAAAGKVPWPYSSVEMLTRDKWIISEKLYEAQDILFNGAAMVNQGACRTCKIRNNEGEPEAPSPIENTLEETMADTKELEAKVEALTKELETMKAKPVETPKLEIPKELSDAISTISTRLEKLEKSPAPTVTSPTIQERELGTVETVVVIDKVNKTVRGV